MKKFLIPLFFLFICEISYGETPIKVTILDQQCIAGAFTGDRVVPCKGVKITSLEDEIFIKKINLNRSNCKVLGGALEYAEVKLKYGSSSVFTTSCDEILEMKIETSKGSFSYRLN